MRSIRRISLGAIGQAVVIGGFIVGYALGSVEPKIPTTIDVLQTSGQQCTRQSLTIKEGETDAAMGGVRRTPFTITNVSKSACVLEGYPLLELLNKAGAVMKRATKEKTDEQIAPATIEAGKTAWFALNYNVGGAGYMGKPCPTYKRVRITLTAAARLVIQSDMQSCGKTQFEVTPIRLGAPE